MNKKIYFVSLAILFLFTLSTIPAVSYADDDDKSYSIPYANIDLYVQDDGMLHVKEQLHYSFSGTYNGVYRDIPIKSGEQIENIKVYTSGAYSTVELTNSSNMQSLKIYLYSDAAKTTPITDQDVDVYIEYDFVNVVKIYNDVAGLQFKLWGEDWDVDVGKLTANIHLKSEDGVKYWLNPPYFVADSSWQNSTLQVISTPISSGNWFEVRMAIPKDQFQTNPPYAQQVDMEGLAEMERIQNDYANEINFKGALYSVLAILMVLSTIIPVIIYYKYGREPKISYQAEYERDLPTDDSPAVVNAICGSGFGKRVGEPDMDGFRATIMDLINRKYLLIKNIPSRADEFDESSLSLQINEKKDLSQLNYFEHDVMNFLLYFEEDGTIYLETIKEDLKDRSTAEAFRDSFNLWKDDLKRDFLPGDVLKTLFLKKGDTYLKIYGGLGLCAAFIIIVLSLFDPLPQAAYVRYASIFLGAVSIISLVMPQKIAGQWTTHGEEYDAKWQNFKKYIKDFSLIKEYPPESVKVWNKYLVYATALGIADEVRKSMEMSVPAEELDRSDIYLFHYYGGYVILSSSLDAGMTTATSGGAGGVGGVGGGSGGGGGGAF
ncbi:DUF2207 domain-containing protein [Methanobacterium ferruginis]|uniref:DUF2207 domain-containing protein n=1 Tax=Methanobacterium ferruginis TaxID=710191 RepID=UPI002573ADAD|nr:DUF2207 domain-containing protein [Methanobacterium ferruginis]BDZ67313.1 hypothetical protein GCM10025860_07610 [Methanobacterium ferruginis]